MMSLFLFLANCESFVIDIGLEILVLYERIYEIYGDIIASKNCFDIDAYEMGKHYLVCYSKSIFAVISNNIMLCYF